jgi:DNA polymerase-3 subunit delta'
MDPIELIYNKLKNCIETNKLPHAILFHGPCSQSDKDDFVYSAAKMIMHPKKDIDDKRFSELCRTSQYSDFINIVRTDTGKIKLESLEQLDGSLAYLPFESKNRIVYIPNADQMTVQAQNSILKLIEEPPERTVIILTVNKKNKLLPTILSRTVLMYFPEKCEHEVLKYFPFIRDDIYSVAPDYVEAQIKEFEILMKDSNLQSLKFIDRLYSNLTESESIKKITDTNNADFLKKNIIMMRLAFSAFFIKNSQPDVSKRIIEFLNNSQTFSFDASVFYTLIGEEIGKK